MKTYIANIDDKWYAFGEFGDSQFCSIGRDAPKKCWCVANRSEGGIKYVASPSASRQAAYQKAKRYGEYSGIISY